MAIPQKYRRLLLGAGLALTVAAVASVSSNNDDDSGVVEADSSRSRGHAPRTAQAAGEASQPVARLDLKLNRPALPENARDMFKSKSWYVPPAEVKAAAARPVAPPLPFTYIGKIAEEDSYVVFLESQGRIYTVKAGDAIDQNYRVDDIKPPLMTLTYLPMQFKQTMQIGEMN